MYRSSAFELLACQRENAAQKLARSNVRRDIAAQTVVDGRIALFETLTNPVDLAIQFGPNLGHDAMQLQRDSHPARASAILGDSDAVASGVGRRPQEVKTPTVVSLNGQPSQVNGCTWTLPPHRTVQDDNPIPLMPLRAPVSFETPIGPASFPPAISPEQPVYSNLCWALRNAAVDSSQFDPAELMALQFRCSQLGYSGSCASPPNALAYLDRGRRSGTLPHIQVGADLLDSLTPAPDLTGINCPTSYRMSGGLTGTAPTWADALAAMGEGERGAYDASRPDSPLSWIAEHPWLTLALAAGGAVLVSRRKGR